VTPDPSCPICGGSGIEIQSPTPCFFNPAQHESDCDRCWKRWENWLDLLHAKRNERRKAKS
jgi:hypothetical protein